VRLDSPVVLATAGTLAIHLLLAVAGDAIVVLNPVRPYHPPPVVELVDIDPPEVKAPPPPIEKAPELKQPTEPEPVVQKVVRHSAPPPPTNEPPPPPETPPPTSTPATEGGAPVAQMEGIAPSATGVPVAYGKPHDRVGRGGTGTGTGAGSGAGSSEAPTQVASVATIKTRAMPKGDFSYFDASKDYPPEAKALGIEGVIRVRLVVDDHGKVIQTTLLNRLGHGLDELALARAAKIEFDPAKDTDDKAVRSVVIWTFNMTLPK